jgi:hypothetical protein
MTCADFDTSFNAYVDDMLSADEAVRCRSHIAKCMSCNREVTRWQQSRILLSTAVADFATAVDLSSVRSGVHAALGFTDDTAVGRQDGDRAGRRQAAFHRGESARPSIVRRRGQRGASSGRRGALLGAFRFASAAAVSASVAAAAVLMLTPQPQTAAPVVASAKPYASRTSYEPAAFRFGKKFHNSIDAAPVSYTPPPLARPETPHVDGLEAAPGHLVSTWVQPRTNARVIWVQDRGVGAPIRTAGLDR